MNVLIYDSHLSLFKSKKNKLMEKFLSTAGLIMLEPFFNFV